MPPATSDRLVQSTVTLANGRRWLALNGHLVTPLSFTGHRPARIRKGVVEFLAMAHHFKGLFAARGSARHIGARVASLGLVSVVANETRDGRKLVHYRLIQNEAVRDLAARCAYVTRGGATVSISEDGEGANMHTRNTLTWDAVPAQLPQYTWLPGARPCPRCRCTPDAPCTVLLDDGGGEGTCVPAGVFNIPTCSNCETGRKAASAGSLAPSRQRKQK